MQGSGSLLPATKSCILSTVGPASRTDAHQLSGQHVNLAEPLRPKQGCDSGSHRVLSSKALFILASLLHKRT